MQEALNADLTALSNREARRVTKLLMKTNAERYERQRARGIYSPAYGRKDKKPLKTIPLGSNIGEVRNYFIKAKQQLEAETSTVRGYNQFLQDVSEGFQKAGADINLKRMTQEERNRFFKAWDNFKKTESGKYKTSQGEKYRVMEKIAEVVQEGKYKTIADVVGYMERVTEEEYENTETAEDFDPYNYGGF